MRIIKSGILQKRYCCSFCKCEFEIDGSDIKTSTAGCSSNLITSSYQSELKYVICPECGNKITVSTEGTPNVYITANDIYDDGTTKVTPGKMEIDAVQKNIGSTVWEVK